MNISILLTLIAGGVAIVALLLPFIFTDKLLALKTPPTEQAEAGEFGTVNAAHKVVSLPVTLHGVEKKSNLG